MSQQGKKEELDQDRSVIDTFMPEHLLRTIQDQTWCQTPTVQPLGIVNLLDSVRHICRGQQSCKTTEDVCRGIQDQKRVPREVCRVESLEEEKTP